MHHVTHARNDLEFNVVQGDSGDVPEAVPKEVEEIQAYRWILKDIHAGNMDDEKTCCDS